MKKFAIFLLFLIFCFLSSLLFVQCSPEMQKSVQKAVSSNIVSNGVNIAKGKVPERRLELKRVGKTNLFEANDFIGSYKVVMLNDSIGVLYANVNWEAISTHIVQKMHETIDKGVFVIKAGKGKEQASETTKETEQPK